MINKYSYSEYILSTINLRENNKCDNNDINNTIYMRTWFNICAKLIGLLSDSLMYSDISQKLIEVSKLFLMKRINKTLVNPYDRKILPIINYATKKV